jgi:SAM-dependent methyltransferase
MRDQRALWESIYEDRPQPDGARGPNEFAVEVAQMLAPHCRILELGCGTGADARYLAALGHEVVALDHSLAAIERANTGAEATANLRFEVHDIATPFDSAVAASFDVVYAHLSLHYFSDAVTKRLFQEIARLLKPSGLLAFTCRSTADSRHGRGLEIEPHLFDADHLRHFFSVEYAAECLRTDFVVVSLTEERGPLYGSESAYVKALSRRV